ncbi:enoyl-CoA hydratase-related protein [Paraconexibacter antarcticus]|uniref:Enoyl-CoA hydratase-related protein n=1 Tax=Paraconexibacter antarcticus TaxID=2949664 RepID=A0ABY5DX07_9ACTN|nr:enoyl-CoA hydratase-related protein [Paraconexibacter antarcticus]UTI66206.1 enoyl-CoA hydratase-related protein [Paraconexibacter antarcticus]
MTVTEGASAAPTGGLAEGIDPWLRLEQHRGTLILTLNRPERRNAVAWGQIAQIATVLERAAADDSVRVVVLTGEGVAFSAGGDVKDQASRREWGTVERLRRAAPMIASIQAVWDFPKPLIAAVNGVAAGAGVGMALLCDMRLASAEARLGFAFVRVGLGPDYGVSYTLPRTVGPGHAARLLYSGAYVEADEALRLGLVDSVHAPEQLLPGALALAAEIAERAPFGVRLAKAALRRAGSADLATTLRTEMQGQFLATATEDHREGTLAFAEKRTPKFRDR